MAEAVPILKAQERLEAGEVGLDAIYDVALLASGSEEVASEWKVAKMKALNLQKSMGG